MKTPSFHTAFKSFADLTENFTRTRNLLRSDGAIAENGTLNTKAGASRTSQHVLDHLEAREVARAASAAEKEAREASAAQRRLEREIEANELVLVRQDAQQARVSNASWLALRGERSRRLVNSRGQRRLTAIHRALRIPVILPQN